MDERSRAWAEEHLTGIILAGVLTALEHIPEHRVPRIQLDSQSPWAYVDAIPGPRLAVWLATGAVCEVGEDGSVGEEPIAYVS